MTDARVTAILGDSRQHLPAFTKRLLDKTSIANAQRIRDRQSILPSLPPIPPLSEWGIEFTRDAFSYSDAHELAEEGDALFFYLSRVERSDNIISTSTDGQGFISFNSFSLLKQFTMKQKADVNCSFPGEGRGPISGVWLPCYFTESVSTSSCPLVIQKHFSRAILLLPCALGYLSSNDPLAFRDQDYRLLFDHFGQHLYELALTDISTIRWSMLAHKVTPFFYNTYSEDANVLRTALFPFPPLATGGDDGIAFKDPKLYSQSS